MPTSETSAACWTCPTFRPDTTARIPNRPPVCDGDRTLIDRHLADIANLHADLSNDEQPLADQRRYERFDRNGASLGEVFADPLAHFGGVAPINSRSKQPNVSGSRERPIPIAVTALDLRAGARIPGITASPHVRTDEKRLAEWLGDQIGHLSTSTVLDQWVRDIRDTLYPGHHLPPATVDELVMWLRHRVEDVCDRHPAITDFAEEIRNLRSTLRSVAGETEPPPERCEGIPCKRCDMTMMFRRPGGSVDCMYPDCSAVYTDDDYLDWVKTLAAEQRIKRHAAQNA